MLIVDLPVPKTCSECLMNCIQPNIPPSDNVTSYNPLEYYQVLCRFDFRKHEPLDELCPIKGIKED